MIKLTIMMMMMMMMIRFVDMEFKHTEAERQTIPTRLYSNIFPETLKNKSDMLKKVVQGLYLNT